MISPDSGADRLEIQRPPRELDELPPRADLPLLRPLAVDAGGAGALAGVSRAHWWRLVGTGRAPRGLRLGKRRVWAVKELEEWLAAGAPPADRWEQLRHGAIQ